MNRMPRLRLKGESFFGDANIYFPGRYEVGEKSFSSEEWEDFKSAVGNHASAVQQNPALDAQFRIGESSLQKIGGKAIGPTARYEELDQ